MSNYLALLLQIDRKFAISLFYNCVCFSVTIARAIELKHNPGLISALSKETSNMYTNAHDSLESLDQKIFGHWKLYFGLKSKFYLAYVTIF